MDVLKLVLWVSYLTLSTFFCNAEVGNNNKLDGARIFKRAVTGAPQTLDVHKTSGSLEMQIIGDLFTPLLDYAQNGDLIAGVAEKWEISKDGTVYTFYLRESKWSNGEPVVAEDFVYTFQRIADPKNGNINTALVLPIQNADKIISGEEKDLNKLGVKAIDARTFEVTLTEPMPHFPQLVAYYSFPVHRKSIEKHGDAWTRPDNMVCNGPFKLDPSTSWLGNNYITLLKNDFFFDADTVELDVVRFEVITEALLQLRKFKVGEIDVTSPLGAEQYILAKKDLPKQIVVENILSTMYLLVNKEKSKIFQEKPNLVKALSLAINRDALIKLSMNGLGTPAFGIVPKGVNNYDVEPLEAELLNQEQREKLAKEIYKKEMGDTSMSVKISYPMKPDRERIVPVISDSWKKVLNVRGVPDGREWQVWLSEVDNHNFDVTLIGWAVETNDPYTALSIFLENDTNNCSKYKNPEYDKLFKAANKMVDMAARANKLREAEKILLDDGVAIPLSYTSHAVLLSPEIVSGWSTNKLNKRPSRYIKLKKA